MGYFRDMAALLPLLALAALTAPTIGDGATRASGATATATRFAGATATVRVSARIVRDSARIGASFGAPAPTMVARRMTLAAADGSAVPALVYDFE
jgi:hypothetical protein